jgi:2-methylcitrate dehydratase PrpD
VLGLIALFQRAGLKEFDEHYNDPRVAAFKDKVDMTLDPEVDRAYPARWIGKVTVETAGGRILHGRVDEPRGDPGNTLTRGEIEEKALRLARYSGAATPAEMASVFARVRELTTTDQIAGLLIQTSADISVGAADTSVRATGL